MNETLTAPATYEVTLTITAKVTVTDEILEGIKDQYPGLYKNIQRDPEAAATAMLFASLNPSISGNEYNDDWWDGVGNMRGLIKDVELF